MLTGTPESVLQVLRKGYLAGDILVRPAGVLIADPGTAEEPEGGKEESNA